ncbi:hypothetical protein psyc5s11_40620 [Clostridium gelidum]|uniref:DUF7674 domain-containing protein n=1 Tax=Clostridium gelidum TaxID=704125 RepID=A0ABM7T9Z6_9CLOT|nr:hypothetical protein [Clostridium gelidum]BCZ47995.1 hypothetical protein psyc5s11_40620 [Clostridium gelidum]
MENLPLNTDFDTVVEELIKEIPEVKPFYDMVLKQWHGEEPGPHIIFEDVLNPYLVNLLKINEDRELIIRIFNFLEKMATNDEFLVQNSLLEFTVLERLSKDDTILAKSKEYMGKETKSVCDEAVFFNYNTAYKELIKEIPEIKPFCDKKLEQNYGEETEKYSIFKDVLNPYLINLLEINENKELISRIFNFLERMATSHDYILKNVLELTVLDELAKDKTILTKSPKYMGEYTKEMNDKSQFINNNTVEIKLLKEIPEIKPFYYKKLEMYHSEEPQRHIIFEDVLNPYLVNLIKIDEDRELISRIFNFLEKIATSYYNEVQDVLRYLGYDMTILSKSQKYMGKETKKITHDIEKVLGKLMVQRENVMELLINLCPSFEGKWKEHLEDNFDRDCETILYRDLYVFARHLTELTINNSFGDFNDIFDEIERLIQEGDSFVSDAIVVGLLEDFQNGLLSNGYELKIMEKYLKPDTKKYWIALIKYWNP